MKDDLNDGEKEKRVVVGTVEARLPAAKDLSGKAKAEAAELSGEKAKENTSGTGLSEARAEENTPKPSVAKPGENTTKVSGEKT